jgi:hypothetical protein
MFSPYSKKTQVKWVASKEILQVAQRRKEIAMTAFRIQELKA